MKFLQCHIPALARGAAVLGSGGGGSTLYQERIVSHLLMQGKQIDLISMDELKEEDLVVPIAFMGAPLAALEKMPSGIEADSILDMLKNNFGRERRIVLMPAEIGGANAFTPLWIGALHGLPVLDADGIGRAFPQLQMTSLHLAGISPSPTFLADSDGKRAFLSEPDPHALEKKARAICVTMGSRSLAALYIMSSSDAKKSVIVGSITKAVNLGRDLLASGSRILTEKWEARHLASGVIRTVDYRIEGGFLKGFIEIKRERKEPLTLRFINEFLAVEEEGLLMAETPDIIILLEESGGRPVSTSEVKWGLSVEVMVLPSPPLWKSQKGLELTGLENHVF